MKKGFDRIAGDAILRSYAGVSVPCKRSTARRTVFRRACARSYSAMASRPPGSSDGSSLTTSSAVWLAVTVMVSVSVTTGPDGGVPLAVARLVTEPASRSAWVTV